MGIDISKILTISSREWFEISGKNPTAYTAVGVHHYNLTKEVDTDFTPTKDFAEKVPEDAEVVVSYKVNFDDAGHYEANGTAIIRRR